MKHWRAILLLAVIAALSAGWFVQPPPGDSLPAVAFADMAEAGTSIQGTIAWYSLAPSSLLEPDWWVALPNISGDTLSWKVLAHLWVPGLLSLCAWLTLVLLLCLCILKVMPHPKKDRQQRIANSLVILLILAAFLGFVNSHSQPAITRQATVLRSLPGPQGEVSNRLKAATPLLLIESNDTYSLVKTKNVQGWIPSEAVQRLLR